MRRLARLAAGGVAFFLLIAAIVLVRAVRLSRWRSSLGQVRAYAALAPDAPAPGPPAPGPPAPGNAPRARSIGRIVGQAARWLPFPVKCLPRAVATQWLLRLLDSPSSLVIAVHAHDRAGEHAFHAWVESGDEIVIGHCERPKYRAIMAFDQPPEMPARA